MKTSLQVRLDPESRRMMTQLVRRLGWSPSKIVREGLRLLAGCHLGTANRRIVGLGQFASGVEDLGSNKEHLRGFGS